MYFNETYHYYSLPAPYDIDDMFKVTGFKDQGHRRIFSENALSSRCMSISGLNADVQSNLYSVRQMRIAQSVFHTVFMIAANNIYDVNRHYMVTAASWQRICMLDRSSARTHWQT